MSIAAVSWALDQAPVQNAQEHVLLLALGDQADQHGRGAWPSRKTLAKRGRCSVRTVQRHLNAMEKRGLIVRGDQRLVAHLRGDNRPVVWDLALWMVIDETAPQTDEEARAAAAGGQQSGADSRGDKLSHGTFRAEPGDNQGSETRGQIVPGDTAMAPSGVTQLWHTNRPLNRPSSGGSVLDVTHQGSAIDANTPKPEIQETTAPEPSTAPLSRHCPRHPLGTPDRCGQCAEARKAFEVAELAAKEARRAEGRAVIAALTECPHCDDYGWRDEPAEVAALDLPPVRCAHTPWTLADWRAFHQIPATEVRGA